MSKKTISTTPALHTETVPADFSPTQKQIDILARRLMPEIKKFFANEKIQKEFAEWKEKQSEDK